MLIRDPSEGTHEMLPTLEFGNTGHRSTRVVFGAAALLESDERKSAHTLDLLLRHGVNHIDAAASYGDAEIWVGHWMREHRDAFVLATKTGERTYAAARDQIRRSLERLEVTQVDLIQLHNLVKEDEWEIAFSDDGAVRAAVEARDEGLVRFIGVTGHGTRVADMHRRSLDRFAFDSVLLPYNYMQMQDADYRRGFDALQATCDEHGVAVQTIKSVARRRWEDGATPTHTTWYEPLTASADIDRAVAYALDRPGIFVSSASDVRLFEATLEAARRWSERSDRASSDAAMREVERAAGLEALFIRGMQTARTS